MKRCEGWNEGERKAAGMGGAEHMAYEEVVEQEEVTVGRERAFGDGSHWY